jgi:DNA-binding NarL/FixJ family response regulator
MDKQEIMKTRGKCLTTSQLGEIKRRNKKIVELKRSGCSYQQIANKFDLSREYIKVICHKAGVSGPTFIRGSQTALLIDNI